MSDNTDQKKVLETSFDCFFDGKHGIGIIFFARKDDGFYIKVGILVRIEITDNQTRLCLQLLQMLQTAITKNYIVICT